MAPAEFSDHVITVVKQVSNLHGMVTTCNGKKALGRRGVTFCAILARHSFVSWTFASANAADTYKHSSLPSQILSNPGISASLSFSIKDAHLHLKGLFTRLRALSLNAKRTFPAKNKAPGTKVCPVLVSICNVSTHLSECGRESMKIWTFAALWTKKVFAKI